MRHTDLSVAEGVSGALRTTWRCLLNVFENTPVILHSVDRQFRMLRVNRRWLEKMGYERAEALGREIPDFKSEESRLRAESDTRPFLLRAGASRGIWSRYIRKDGLALDVLTDADLWDHRCCFAYMAMCDEGEDPGLWQQSLATLETLSLISSINRSFAQILSPGVGGWAPPPPPAVPWVPGPGRETGLVRRPKG